MTIHDIDAMPEAQFKKELLKCCGSTAWVNRMYQLVPFEDLVELLNSAEEEWFSVVGSSAHLSRYGF